MCFDYFMSKPHLNPSNKQSFAEKGGAKSCQCTVIATATIISDES